MNIIYEILLGLAILGVIIFAAEIYNAEEIEEQETDLNK